MGPVRRRIRTLSALVLLAGCASVLAPGHVNAAAERAASPRLDPREKSCVIPALRATVLRQVNAARASGHQCADRPMAAVPPLAWNDALSAAAARHSADMARRDYFDHASPEGRRAGARASAEGYSWRAIGENIAGGDRRVDDVMRDWLASEGHCRNIMNPEFSDIGVACFERNGTTWGTYWTMVLGRRR